jgi:hypothetical protein
MMSISEPVSMVSEAGYGDCGFSLSLTSRKRILDWYFKIGHSRFLPWRSQYLILESFSHLQN